jgi:uncharacterized phage protein (TIGR02218 family)
MTDIMNGTICNCIKISLVDGAVHGYTDYDTAITVSGVTYNPAPGLQKVKMSMTANAEVSNQELASGWGLDVNEDDLRGGKFDSATIEVSWASWKNPSYGNLVVFTGQLGEVTWTEEGFKADIVSFMKNLAKNIGNVFTANCRHTLFSQGGAGFVGKCGVSNSSFASTGSVGAITIPKWKFAISTSKADGYYDNGQITFTSGYNNGLSAVIKSHVGGVLELYLPTAFVIAPGDTYTIYAGCDKTLATCKSKFNNVLNYGGFPHIKPDVNFQ